jgi:hypothetical protein
MSPENEAMLLSENRFLIRRKKLAVVESGISVFCCVFEGRFGKSGWLAMVF